MMSLRRQESKIGNTCCESQEILPGRFNIPSFVLRIKNKEVRRMVIYTPSDSVSLKESQASQG